MCSERTNSVLRSKDASELQKFAWQYVNKEAKKHAPILYSILEIAISELEKEYMIGFLMAFLCHLHWRNMNLHLKVILCMLYADHASKQVSSLKIAYIMIKIQVYECLKKLHLCTSHLSTIRMLDSLGENFVSEVMKLKEELETRVLCDIDMPENTQVEAAIIFGYYYVCNRQAQILSRDLLTLTMWLVLTLLHVLVVRVVKLM